jgi:hypothetical protein
LGSGVADVHAEEEMYYASCFDLGSCLFYRIRSAEPARTSKRQSGADGMSAAEDYRLQDAEENVQNRIGVDQAL